MILADELILHIGSNILEFIGDARQRCAVSRVKVRVQTEGSDGQGVAVPTLFVGQAPIRRGSGDHVALGAIKRMNTTSDCRGVVRDLSVKVIIQPYVNAEATHMLAEAAGATVDLGGR